MARQTYPTSKVYRSRRARRSNWVGVRIVLAMASPYLLYALLLTALALLG